MKYASKLGVLVASLSLCLAMVPAVAWAEPEVIVKTFSWTSLESQPAFPESITNHGQTFVAGDPVIKEKERMTPTAPASHTETKECWPADLDATRAAFERAYQVEEDGYKGEIPLIDVAVEPYYALRQWEVNEARVFAGLPSNDVAQLPQTIQVAGSSGGNALTLSLASLSWKVDSRSASGLPSSYTASAIYRGVDGQTVLDHYAVTATWEGEVPAQEPVVVYEASVEYVSAHDGDSEGGENSDLNLLPLIAGAVAAVAAASLGGFFFWRRGRDVKVCVLRNGTLKVVATTASKRAADGALLVNLPASIDWGFEKVALVLRKDKISGMVRVFYCGTQIHEVQAQETIWLP